MFNVTALLLEDALQPVDVTDQCVINETWQFASLSDISQGSVATHLRYGGICNDSIIAIFSWFWL